MAQLQLAALTPPPLLKAPCAISGRGVRKDTKLQKRRNLKMAEKEAPKLDPQQTLWHTASHVMASAIKLLWPDSKLGTGPAVEGGFYYDIQLSHTISQEDFPKIEEKARGIMAADQKLVRREVGKAEARKLFADQNFKLQLIEELPGETVTTYTNGEFTDLCAGPHVESTGKVKAFKLMKLGAAYWKNDARNPQLQRVYGIAFSSQKEMDDYLFKLAEAERRDHHRLGRELGLFMTHELSLPGSPFMLKNGAVVYNELMKLIREEYLRTGYQEVVTPQMFKKKLWETSGHWEHYRDSMFCFKVGEEEYALKAMNCPSHLLIYTATSHSYKDLPLRIADFCPLHRNELAGVIGGLTRVTKLSQDDAHIFVTPDQLEAEIGRLLEMMKRIYSGVFGFEYRVKLSTKPENSMGDAKLWEKAEASLAAALKGNGVDYVINAGDGAFYGPKIDVDIADAIGRQWQCATFQLDFQMPLRFGAEFVNEKGQKEPVIMIHRAILGSLERFIGVLIEHYAGAFPTWLAPVQVMLLPMTDGQNAHAQKLCERLLSMGVRAEVDSRSEKLEAKIRNAQTHKVPYMLVIGKREQENNTLSVRKRTNEVKQGVPVEQFLSALQKEIAGRSGKLEAA